MPNSSAPKVLIVDDVPENLHILMEVLKSDYIVVAAKNGEKALLLAETTPQPDVILLDVMMPGMDGYEVCLKLKANPATWSIPVIFITALSDAEDEARGLAVGGVDFISKPFKPALVKARVRSHLELKRHKDRLEEMVAERTRELALTQDVTIMTMASLAETRDPETGSHILRTQHYVKLLAQTLQHHPRFAAELSDAAIELLFKSAPLHDIGKVGVPDHILLKPGKLTDEEFKEMKKHCGYGWNAIKAAQKHLGSNSFLRYAGEIAFTHHEKWDGTGYPRGLKGEEIPLSGRLMALADVYDALTSKRVYKAAFSHETTLDIIRDGVGKHFDPDVAEAFFACADEFKRIAEELAPPYEELEYPAGIAGASSP